MKLRKLRRWLICGFDDGRRVVRTTLRNIRYWLILRLAGQDMIIINGCIKGTVTFDGSKPGLIYGTAVFGDGEGVEGSDAFMDRLGVSS